MYTMNDVQDSFGITSYWVNSQSQGHASTLVLEHGVFLF